MVVGDTIQVAAELVEARLSESRRSGGVVRFRNVIINHRGEAVQTDTPVRTAKSRGSNTGTAGAGRA